MRTGRCAGAAFCEKGGIVCARFVRFSVFSDNLLKKSGKTLDFSDNLWYTITVIKMYADLAHLVERNLAKVEVAGPSPVIRLRMVVISSILFSFYRKFCGRGFVQRHFRGHLFKEAFARGYFRGQLLMKTL